MAVEKGNTNGSAKGAASLGPTKPTVVCRGKVMSREFSDGAYAPPHVVGKLMKNDAGYGDNEHRTSMLLAKRLTELFDRGGEFRSGVIAAVANRIVTDITGLPPNPENWKPLQSLPAFEGNVFTDHPHACAALFEVGGDPVSVTPDLVALRWGRPDEEPHTVSVELVRAIGRPVTRERSDEMRERLAAQRYQHGALPPPMSADSAVSKT